MFCVWQLSMRGCCFSFVFVYFIIKVLNVRRFPPPSFRSKNCVRHLFFSNLQTNVGLNIILCDL